jgi:guanylate kinase
MLQSTISREICAAQQRSLDEVAGRIARAAMDVSSELDGHTRRGLLIVLSSPSGAGKSTIAKKLLETEPGVSMSVSVTTRPMRSGETDHVHYHFVDQAEFDRMQRAGEFVEWASVFGFCYGTPKSPVKQALKQGQDTLFDIDWQGARQLEPDFADNLVTIFLLPPSMQELERRLRARGTDSEAVVADRMRRAADEISHWAEYEYVLVNDDMDVCLERVRAIVAAERSKRTSQPGLVSFVRDMIGPSH